MFSRFALIAFACLGALLLVGCFRPVPEERDLLIATATTGGTFYPVGVALATLLTQETSGDERLLASAITSSGSAENIRMLENGEVQLGIIQAIFGTMAHSGSGVYEGRPVEELRGLTMLWPNVEQVVVMSRFAPAWEMSDFGSLRGERVSLTSRWSGSEVSARTILEALGYMPGDAFVPVNLDYGASADALQNRRISGMFLGGGVPTGAITQAFARMGDEIRLLEFSDEELVRLRSHHQAWDRFVIPAGTYPGQREPVRTVAQPNLLVSTTAVSEEVVYEVLAILWDNLDYLQRQHAATRIMAFEKALPSMPLPLHPGAVRFYQDRGLTVPEELIAQGAGRTQ